MKSRNPATPAAAPVQSRSRRPTPSLAPVVAPIVARVRLARGSTRELSTSPPQVAPHSTARGTTQSTQSTAPVRPKPPVPTARSDSTPASRSVLVPAKGLRRPPLEPLPSAQGSLPPQASLALPLAADPLLETLPQRELLPPLGSLSPLAKQQEQPKEQAWGH